MWRVLGLVFVSIIACIISIFVYKNNTPAFKNQPKPKMEVFTYLPENCPTEAYEKIYNRVGGSLFGFTEEQKSFQIESPKGEAFGTLGCPTNPITGTPPFGGMRIPWSATPYMKNRPEETKGESTQMREYHGGFRATDSKPRDRKSDFSQKVAATCNEVGEQKYLDFTACIKMADFNEHIKHGAGYYIAEESIYKTPLGEKFIVKCSHHWGSGSADCAIEYQFNQDGFVKYNFSRAGIPLKYIIEFDRQVRQLLNEALVE